MNPKFAVRLLILAASLLFPGLAGGQSRPAPAAEALAEGDRLLQAGYPVLAIRHYREALAAGAPREAVGLRLAHAHCAAGDYVAAAAQLEPLQAGGGGEALLLLARVRFWQERYDQAWAPFRNYLELTPKDAAARLDYALSLAWGRRFADALVELAKLEKVPEHKDEARLRTAEVLSWQKDYPRARKLLAELLAPPGAPPAYRSRCLVLLGRMLAWEKEFAGAEAQYQLALAANPVNEEAWLALGEVQEWQGRLDDARASYGKALQAAPGSTRARAALERVHRE